MILFLSLDNSIQDHKVFLFQIGGRVKDVQFGGITVELGANWVHRLQIMIKTIISDKINQLCLLSKFFSSNIRATQSKKDGNGMRYNPIEDLVKVTFFLSYIMIKLF